MRLTRKSASIVGILTIAPLVCFLALAVYMRLEFMSLNMPGGTSIADFHHTFDTVYRVNIVVSLPFLGMLVYYFIYLVRTDRVPADKKALWGVVLFLGNFVAMPIFWYFYMWPSNSGIAQQPVSGGAPSKADRP